MYIDVLPDIAGGPRALLLFTSGGDIFRQCFVGIHWRDWLWGFQYELIDSGRYCKCYYGWGPFFLKTWVTK